MLKFKSEIKSVSALEILDSRGNPTVEATVVLESGAYGTASVPSGASTGEYEAYEKRDGGNRYFGKGVLGAVDSVNGTIAPALVGVSALDRVRADSIMIALDGTQNKSNLGANAILSVSLAIARAAAMQIGVPLYRYLGGAAANTLPIPMMNILNGGAHSNNNLDIQEFMIVPHGAQSVTESIRMGTEVYHMLKDIIAFAGYSTALGDEGGFAPELPDEFAALDIIVTAIEKAGYRPGEDISIALDVASSEWYRTESSDYYLPKSKRTYTREDLLRHLKSIAEKYPIISIEDGMGENDIEGWKMLSQSSLGKIMLVGDDLFVTNKERLMMGVENGIGNSILIKPNQIGTVSEVMDAIQYAKAKNYRTVMSHRSGETADTFIADFAVAMGSEFIKTGAPSRSERTEKYNRLMRIENELFSPVFSKEFI